MITPELKITVLQKQLDKLVAQVNELNKRVQFLERENGRRKQDIQTVANRKG